MNCYTFEEWFRICEGLKVLYWSCFNGCMKEAKTPEDFDRCINDCTERAIEQGKKNGLNKEQSIMCARTVF